MSVYPPPSHLPQAPYPHHAFPSIPPQYGFPQPVQPPIPYFSDSIQFRQFYAHKLRGLTENSKPAIHALSMIAQDFARWGEVVVQCIENHIRRVSPSRFFLSTSPSQLGVEGYPPCCATSCVFILVKPQHLCTLLVKFSRMRKEKNMVVRFVRPVTRPRRQASTASGERVPTPLLMLLPYLSFRGLLTNHCLICIQIPPPFKLTAFYLLDAISKNLYEPYARHFGPVVVPLFLDTYSQVDDSTKAKMIEMLATWRAGAPNGRELFGAVPQLAIEQELFGTGTPSVRSFGDRLSSLLVTLGIQDTARVSSAQVLGELQFAIGQAEREMQSNPYNNTVRTQLPVLHQVRFIFSLFPCDQTSDLIFQLRQFVEKGLSPDELHQILSQLRNITRPAVQLPPQSYPVAPSISALPPPNTYSQYSYNHAGPSSAPPQSHPLQPAYPQDTLDDVKPSFPPALPVQSVPVAPPAPTNKPSVPALPAVSDIANLYSALVKAGMVGVPGTPPVVSSVVNESKPEPADSSSKTISEHTRKLLSQRIELSTTGIARYVPDAFSRKTSS
jgi:hypothetical protein